MAQNRDTNARVLEQLRGMFPQFDDDTLIAALVAHYGHTGMAIDALLTAQSYDGDKAKTSLQVKHSASPSFYGNAKPLSAPVASSLPPRFSNSPRPTPPSTPPPQSNGQPIFPPPPPPLTAVSRTAPLSPALTATSVFYISLPPPPIAPVPTTTPPTELISEDDWLAQALDRDVYSNVSVPTSNHGKRLQTNTLNWDGSQQQQQQQQAQPSSKPSPPTSRFEDDDLSTWITDRIESPLSEDSQPLSEETSENEENDEEEEEEEEEATPISSKTSIDEGGNDSNIFKSGAKGALKFLKDMTGGGSGGVATFQTDLTTSDDEKPGGVKQLKKMQRKLSLDTAKNYFSTKLAAAHRAAEAAAAAISDSIGHDRDDDEDPNGSVSPNNSLKKPRKLKLNAVIQNAVSKDRTRFVHGDFDLDLTYITPRLIAMSFPAEGLEAAYRNSLEDVARMLKSEHDKGFMVYNLSERSYDISKLNNQVLDFGWPDHQAPPLKLLFTLCMSIDSWLKSDPSHVVSIHCKGGKGRTGTVICSYMIFCGLCKDAQEAIERFGDKRMAGEKSGVTQPAQRRYIRYFKDTIYREIKLHSNSLLLYRINLSTAPRIDRNGRGRPFLRIYQGAELVFATATNTSKDTIKSYGREDGPIAFPMDVKLREDVLIQCFEYSQYTGVSKVFRCQFFIGCVDKLIIRFYKDDLDDACNDKKIPQDFYMDLFFRVAETRKDHHPLEKYIPENMDKLDGDICYYRNQELNAKYMKSIQN